MAGTQVCIGVKCDKLHMLAVNKLCEHGLHRRPAACIRSTLETHCFSGCSEGKQRLSAGRHSMLLCRTSHLCLAPSLLAEPVLGSTTAQMSMGMSGSGLPPITPISKLAICRDWFKAMEEGAPAVLRPMLPSSLQSAAAELAPYWTDSFGNKTRIDYGGPLRYLLSYHVLTRACMLVAGLSMPSEQLQTAVHKLPVAASLLAPQHIDCPTLVALMATFGPSSEYAKAGLDSCRHMDCSRPMKQAETDRARLGVFSDCPECSTALQRQIDKLSSPAAADI